MKVLVTGGLGYIGSNVVMSLSENGHTPLIIDNLSNSDISVVSDLEEMLKEDIFYEIFDICDESKTLNFFKNNEIDAVIHLAGLKSVSESIDNPIKYYKTNLNMSFSLIDAMQKTGVKNLIFSSSANVYGNPVYLPIDEMHPTDPNNPYGKSKLFLENFFIDLFKKDPSWRIIILRYFNPVGANRDGKLGENPSSEPTNLMPRISYAAEDKTKGLEIFGDDYSTHDGTGIRDFIHIVDLSEAHTLSVKCLSKIKDPEIINIGTGKGFSVLDMINGYSSANNIKINYSISPRRKGDIEISYASAKKAKKILNWKSSKDLKEMCISEFEHRKRFSNFYE